MPLAVTKKKEVINNNRTHDKDTGSPEVQIALLTERIVELTGHLEKAARDNGSRRGLLKMVGRRKKLLTYLQKHNFERYKLLIDKLNLRK
ncbi:MAG: 30S ribosomal protein S15 [candidate division Zixibacteria bacterium]|jgi:small subunit ribosomal protein S15|nr:30S ribosomal protein S15 [candidate division Zixibacteria bacterium]